MRVSNVLYAVGFAFFTSALVAEIVEKTQAKKREAKIWEQASAGNGSLSSRQSVPEQSSSQTS